MFAARDIKKQIEKSTLLSNKHVLDGRSANPEPAGSSGHLLHRYLGNSRIQHITEEQQVAERPNIQSEGIQSVPGLQRKYGNRFAQGVVAQHAIQTKLMIGQPGDIYEREADRIAEQIMQMPEPKAQRQLEEEEEEELLQTKSPLTPLWQRGEVRLSTFEGGAREVSPELEARINAMRGGGQPLPASARAFFEPRFGYDFSHVRVHTDIHADSIGRILNARAFTTGSDMFFRQGIYNSGSSGAREVLAHELTHVVQQMSGYQCEQAIAEPRDAYEGQTKHVMQIPELLARQQVEEEDEAWQLMWELFKAMVNYEPSSPSPTAHELIEELTSDPKKGIEIWGKFLYEYREDIDRRETRPEVAHFKEDVENALVKAYAERVLEGAGIGKGDLSERAKEIEGIIADHRQDFSDIMSNGIDEWEIPEFPPDYWPSILSIAGNIANAVGWILLSVPEPTLTTKFVGIALIAGGVEASVHADILDIDRERKEKRREELQKKIKHQTRVGYRKLCTEMKVSERLLARLYAAEAIEADLTPGQLKGHVWRKMFGYFPRYKEDAVPIVKRKMEASLNKFFEQQEAISKQIRPIGRKESYSNYVATSRVVKAFWVKTDDGEKRLALLEQCISLTRYVGEPEKAKAEVSLNFITCISSDLIDMAVERSKAVVGGWETMYFDIPETIPESELSKKQERDVGVGSIPTPAGQSRSITGATQWK